MLSGVIPDHRWLLLGSGYRSEGVQEMLNGDVARYRTEDLVRAGAASRTTRPHAVRGQAARRTWRRRVITMAIALLPIPVKH
jgi:hypothetical protein